MRRPTEQDPALQRRPDEAVIHYVRRVVAHREASAIDVARAVILAPGLETRLLGAANSPLRGRLVPAGSVREAIVDLGLNHVRRLILGSGGARLMEANR